jgi:ABC-type transport system involved in multi-copper enzyme maturation permease subunit
MRMRWGLGPVFYYESLLGARRWQVYALRSAFVLVLLAGMTIIWMVYLPGSLTREAGVQPSYRDMAAIGDGFFYALASIQISLILLAAPAAAAGSLGTERASETLRQMMVTDLSDAEIVLGLLAARLAPVVALIAAAAPVTALAALLGGIDYAALAGALVVSLALALLGCVLALTLSVWVPKTHEVLLAVYMAEGAWMLAAPAWQGTIGAGPLAWFWKAHPYVLAFAPYWQPGYATVGDFAAFSAGVLLLSAALVGLVIVRLRPIVVGQTGRPQRSPRRCWAEAIRTVLPSWPGPSLDGYPLLWREWRRNHPSRLGRILVTLLLSIAWAFAAYGTCLVIAEGANRGLGPIGTGIGVSLVFGLLMLAATAPTTLAEERSRGSLDFLLVTPLTTREVVVAKWWGVYGRVLVMLPLFLYVASFEAAMVTHRESPFRSGAEPVTLATRLLGAGLCPADFLASGALVVSFGVLLATWVRQAGRSIVLSVVAEFLLGMVWPIVIQIGFALIAVWLDLRGSSQLTEGHHCVTSIIGALSPIAGPVLPLNALQWDYGRGSGFWIGVSAVILIKFLVAWLLIELSVRTFDRCLGRVSESPHGAPVSQPLPRP